MREPPPLTTEKPRRTRTGCLWGIVAIQAVLLVALLSGALIAAVAGHIADGVRAGGKRGRHRMGADEYPDLNETWSQGNGEAKVVRIPLQGMIMLGEEEGFFPSAGSSPSALRSIARATHDPDVQAIMLNINSGGGGITASDILYKALMNFKASQDGRLVIAVFEDVAASGAYYVATAADYIVAHPTTLTGSFGVLLQSYNLKELGEKVGIQDVTIKSGKNKDILNPLTEVNEEQLAMLQALIDHMHTRFVKLIAEGRDLSPEQVRELADGRLFHADQALELGLVDEVGYWADAVNVTRDLLDVEDVKIYRYGQEFSLSALLRSAQNWNPARALWARANRTRLMYRWEL